MNKYEFIRELLSDKKTNQNLRDRILDLASIEIKKDNDIGEVLEKRVVKIENIIGLTNNTEKPSISKFNLTKDKIKESNQNLNSPNNTLDRNLSLPKKYLDPSGIYKYLLAYNQDPILKSTCHLIDSHELDIIKRYCKTEVYNFEEHLKQIIISFTKINELSAPSYLKALIRVYLTGKKYNEELADGWSEDNIKLCWSDISIKEWCNKNPGIPPSPDVGLSDKLENSGFQLLSPIKIKDEHIQSLSNLVLHFKRLFHVREDNSLLKILHNQNNFKKWNEKIDFHFLKDSFPENIEFFTDVDKLVQCYNDIIQLIINLNKEERPIVYLTLGENENTIKLSIKCTNREFGKSLESAKIRLIGTKYASIINKLNGICNFYLQADFGQKTFSKLTIWDKNFNIQKERKEYSCDEDFEGGVEHILEFKRR